ncbi:hypothetical protein [Leifsonia sp. Leaf264]|uniref:hypothetical protein n=1 Tax=Leifsonia sp. Leaf264 TaxID=1736314 RepID=UPI000700DEA7|nr:hypothetical protein [Leifsonia sp. Leaf264]KQO98119.1 hypothetical protein ASF30_08465 [Leifsonia sp. Leaf264]
MTGSTIPKYLFQENATITRTTLGFDPERLFFTFWVWVDLEGGGGHGFGDYALDRPHPHPGHRGERIPTEYGMQMISAIIRAVGVNNWEELVGQPIKVVREAGERTRIIGIVPADGHSGVPLLFDDVADATRWGAA